MAGGPRLWARGQGCLLGTEGNPRRVAKEGKEKREKRA